MTSLNWRNWNAEANEDWMLTEPIFEINGNNFWLFHDWGPSHIETSPLICCANPCNRFYMIGTSVMKKLMNLLVIKKGKTRDKALKWPFNKWPLLFDFYGNIMQESFFQ